MLYHILYIYTIKQSTINQCYIFQHVNLTNSVVEMEPVLQTRTDVMVMLTVMIVLMRKTVSTCVPIIEVSNRVYMI